MRIHHRAQESLYHRRNREGLLHEINEELDDLSDLHDLIEAAIMDEPPFAMKEGGIIKDGYNETVDNYPALFLLILRLRAFAPILKTRTRISRTAEDRFARARSCPLVCRFQI